MASAIDHLNLRYLLPALAAVCFISSCQQSSSTPTPTSSRLRGSNDGAVNPVSALGLSSVDPSALAPLTIQSQPLKYGTNKAVTLLADIAPAPQGATVVPDYVMLKLCPSNNPQTCQTLTLGGFGEELYLDKNLGTNITVSATACVSKMRSRNATNNCNGKATTSAITTTPATDPQLDALLATVAQKKQALSQLVNGFGDTSAAYITSLGPQRNAADPTTGIAFILAAKSAQVSALMSQVSYWQYLKAAGVDAATPTADPAVLKNAFAAFIAASGLGNLSDNGAGTIQIYQRLKSMLLASTSNVAGSLVYDAKKSAAQLQTLGAISGGSILGGVAGTTNGIAPMLDANVSESADTVGDTSDSNNGLDTNSVGEQSRLLNAANQGADAIVKYGGAGVQVAGDAAMVGYEAASEGAVETYNTVADGTVNTANTVANGATNTANTVANGTTNTANTVASGTTNLGNTIANAFRFGLFEGGTPQPAQPAQPAGGAYPAALGQFFAAHYAAIRDLANAIDAVNKYLAANP